MARPPAATAYATSEVSYAAAMSAHASTQTVSPVGIASDEAFGVPGIRATTHLWWNWAMIAIQHEALATDARRTAEHAKNSSLDTRQFSAALLQEMHASMVAVTASAFSIDALYAVMKPLIPVPPETIRAWNMRRTRRDRRVLEVLKLGFAIGAVAKQWAVDLAWLWDRRDGGVHFSESSKPLTAHPTGTNTAQEQVDYSAEAASRAVGTSLQVLKKCAWSPKNGLPTATWATTSRDAIQMLLDERVEPGAGTSHAIVYERR